MARYRKISPKIWNDAKFRGLSDNAKLVFFMLLTHPQTSAIGTLRAYIQGLAPEIGWTEKAFREAFAEVLKKGMVKASENDGLIWLPNFMKYNMPESPNVLKSWAPSLDDCPECTLKDEIFLTVKAFAEGLSKAFGQAFAQAFAAPSPNQEQEQEQKQEQEEEDAGDPAPPPSVSPELLDFARTFQSEVVTTHGDTAPKITDRLIEDGALELERAIRLDGLDLAECQKALMWGVHDEFWGQNLKSMARMRTKTRAGVTKLQSVIGGYRKATGNNGSQGDRWAGAL